jgi:hypothetical protein
MTNKQKYLEIMKPKLINLVYAVVYTSAIVVMFLDGMYWRPH